MVKFTSEERENICTSEVIECVFNQGWIQILQSFTALKHNIGCILALVYTSVVASVQDFLNGTKIGVHDMCKQVKLAA